MEEYIDVLDEKKRGGGTGKTALKSEAHRLGLWHKSNHIWILNSKKELLLQHRSKQKESHGDYWDISAAGHMSAGETSIESALRETEEELGVNLNKEDLNLFGTVIQQKIINNGTFINNEFNDLYLVEKDIPISEMTMQESEVQDLKYIHWRELKKWVDSGYEKLVPHSEEYKLLFELLEKKER